MTKTGNSVNSSTTFHLSCIIHNASCIIHHASSTVCMVHHAWNLESSSTVLRDTAFRSTVMFVICSLFRVILDFRFYILDAKTFQVTVDLVEFHRSNCDCVWLCVCVCVRAVSFRGYTVVMHACKQWNAERFIDEVLHTIPCKNLAITFTSQINNCDQPCKLLNHPQSWSFAPETHAEATW